MPETGDPELDELSERYAKNREWARRGTYQTKLSPGLEQEFQGWLFKNQIPYDTHWPPDQSMQDYDMRGFWKAMRAGDPKAVRDPQTGHFPDAWKTPYHETFSDQSIYAAQGAPTWKEGKLVDKAGNVLWGGAARLDPQDDPDAGAEQAVRRDLDPAPMAHIGFAMRPEHSSVTDYSGRARLRNALLSPEEVHYWNLYARGLLGSQATGSGVMNEAQRVAPMPQAYPGVASPSPEYSAYFLNPDAWNDYTSRRAYEAIGGR